MPVRIARLPPVRCGRMPARRSWALLPIDGPAVIGIARRREAGAGEHHLQDLFAGAVAGGRTGRTLRRRAARCARRLHPFLDRGAGRPRPPPSTLPAPPARCWSRSMPPSWGRGSNGSARAATTCSRIFMGRCRLTLCGGRCRCPWAPTATTYSRSLRRDRPVRPLGPAAAGPHRCRERPPARHPGTEGAAARTGAGGRQAAVGAGVRPQFSQSGRHGGRLRQAWRGAGRAVAARLRLCRGRHRDAAAAGRQSAAAAVPAAGRRRRHQPARLQQRGRTGGAGAARGARRRRRPGRGQCRGQQGQPRPHRRLCEPDRDFRPGRELFHASTSRPPTRPGCATCSRAGCSTTCSPAWSMRARG